MKTFITRTTTALIFGAVMISGLLYSEQSFFFLFLLINAGCLWEYFGLIRGFQDYHKINNTVYRIIGVSIGTLIYCALAVFAAGNMSVIYLFDIFPLLFLILVLEIYSLSEKAIVNAALNILGLLYISIPFGLLHFFTIINYNSASWLEHVKVPMAILFFIWANDSFAYIGGSLIGKRKLFPSLSPKKSWEGFIIGIIGSVTISIIAYQYISYITLVDWIVIAILVSVTGTIGDLFESMIKRNLKIKDSGNLLPGHGGLLDRFDAFIFCIPFVYAYLSWRDYINIFI